MSLIFAFARGFTWFARGSLFYCILLNAIVEKKLAIRNYFTLAFKKRPTVCGIHGEGFNDAWLQENEIDSSNHIRTCSFGSASNSEIAHSICTTLMQYLFAQQ